MAILEISVVPVGTNTPSFSSYVTNALKIIDERGLKYQLTPTATVIEGEVSEIFDVAKQIHLNATKNGTERIITNIVIDDRTDKTMTMEHQVEIVQQSLQ